MSATITTEISRFGQEEQRQQQHGCKRGYSIKQLPLRANISYSIKPPKPAEELGLLGGGRAPSPAITNAAAHPFWLRFLFSSPPNPTSSVRALERL
jgi:hypothetical protein